MFEAAVCDHLLLSDAPFVDCQALLALKTVLETARADVLQAQHHSLPAGGGPNATVQTPTTSLATDLVSSATAPPTISDAAAGDPGTNDSTARPTAARARRSNARRR